MYAGLRLGELAALDWSNVVLQAGTIRVERSWDPREEFVDPKSRAGRRSVPIASVLRTFLLEHRLRSGRSDGLVFGRSATRPFNPSSVYRRALVSWQAANGAETKKAGREQRAPSLLDPMTLHEARHPFASLMIAAGVNAKALSTYIGHSSVRITYDRYGHLMPGNENEAAALLDDYVHGSRVDGERVRGSVPER